MSKPEISIIILSHNTKKITDRCLKSLNISINFFTKETGESVELVVADNASSDASEAMIQKKHSWVKLIKSTKNLGFAGGNNLGFKKTKGKYILLLNSDAFVKKETVYKAWRYLEKNSSVDVLGCKLKYKNGSFQPSGGYLPTPFRTSALMLGFDKMPIIKNIIKPIHPKVRIFFSAKNNLEWVMGAFMFMRRAVYRDTNGFDERFFMYTEEVEWCRRIQNKNFKLIYTPSFSVTHLGAASSPDKTAPIIQEAKGLIKYHQKHYPNSVYLIKAVIKLGFIARFILFSMLKDPRAKAYGKALV